MRVHARRMLSFLVLCTLGFLLFFPREPDLQDAMREARTILLQSLGKEHFPIFTYPTGGPYLFRAFPEFNVFVPALIYDLLEPVGASLQLKGFLDELGRIVQAAMLPDGSVPYVGTITSSCLYPPDSDDTAVAARILFPSLGSDRLSRLRNLLQKYRDGRGGYVTWLDEPSRYSCIIPGQDSNPRDVGVNLHLYLFFRRAGWNEEAERLCRDLRHMVHDPRNWVWYRYAPLIPYWRILESQRNGCSLPFPDWMFALVSAEQGEYLELVTAIYGNPLREHKAALLKRFARNHFSFFKEHPPLLYHSDPSAPNHRFYWSPQFAYALWLRLYTDLHREIPHRFPLP